MIAQTRLLALGFAAFLPFSAMADSAANVPAGSTDWGVFIRGGLIAAGLWFAATIAGQLWIRYRQRRTDTTKVNPPRD